MLRTDSFKNAYSAEERTGEASRILIKYPDRVPIILEKGGNEVPDIDKKKYLVPADLTIGQFCYVIRKRLKVNSEKAIFIFVNGKIPPTSSMISLIYAENKDQDGFLYITYAGENTFG